jgi:hypothetical protein
MNALPRCAGPQAALVLCGSILLGCGDSPEAAASCVTLDAECRPLYDPPTFPVIFERILHPTCAQGFGTCHTADARMAGLAFEDEDEAHALLLGESGTQARVLPANPECSLLMQRLASTDPSFRMPPGPTPLLDSELCAIGAWIRRGALP